MCIELKMCIEFQVVMNTKPKTNHAALATQLEIQVETNSLLYTQTQTGKQTRKGLGGDL